MTIEVDTSFFFAAATAAAADAAVLWERGTSPVQWPWLRPKIIKIPRDFFLIVTATRAQYFYLLTAKKLASMQQPQQTDCISVAVALRF